MVFNLGCYGRLRLQPRLRSSPCYCRFLLLVDSGDVTAAVFNRGLKSDAIWDVALVVTPSRLAVASHPHPLDLTHSRAQCTDFLHLKQAPAAGVDGKLSAAEADVGAANLPPGLDFLFDGLSKDFRFICSSCCYRHWRLRLPQRAAMYEPSEF
ncbi:hypothetical protein ACLOJK_023038 [Asimina triloba]